MIYHGIIFTNNELPFKASGAYSIATQLREHGYRAKVVEHFIYLDKNYREQFRKYIFNIIGKNIMYSELEKDIDNYNKKNKKNKSNIFVYDKQYQENYNKIFRKKTNESA